jgi:hypothetical protein
VPPLFSGQIHGSVWTIYDLDGAFTNRLPVRKVCQHSPGNSQRDEEKAGNVGYETVTLIGRFFEWVCDFCGTAVRQSGYGLPGGWKWIPGDLKNPKVRHVCQLCVESKDTTGLTLKSSGEK